MNIGIVGTGNMGRALGVLWAGHGHRVLFGARDAAKAQAAAALAGHGAQAGGNDAAAAFGEVIFYNPRDVDPRQVLADAAALDGKAVIDPNNGPVPDDFAYPPVETSRAEVLQGQIPRARVVKAFNTYAQEVYDQDAETLRAHHVAAFLAGDDAAAKATVGGLAEDLGMAVVDCGPLRQARLLEGLADLTRLLIIDRGFGPLLTLSLPSLPPAPESRHGGRQESRLT